MKKTLRILTFCFATIGALIAFMLLLSIFTVEQYNLKHFTGNSEW